MIDPHIYSCETDARQLERIKTEIKHRLEKFRIGHSAPEFECRDCKDCRRIQELRD